MRNIREAADLYIEGCIATGLEGGGTWAVWTPPLAPILRVMYRKIYHA